MLHITSVKSRPLISVMMVGRRVVTILRAVGNLFKFVFTVISMMLS
jgi:hypothetical protein